MQTTAMGTVANSLPKNEIILLTLLISDWYIPYTDLEKKFGKGLEKFKREVEELSVCVWGGDCIINLQLPKKAYSEFLYIASTSDCRTDNYI